LGSTLSAGSSLGNLTFSFQSKRDKLGDVLDLVKEILREPTFPDKELDILKRNQRQSIEKSMVDPQGLAFRSLMRKVNPYPADDIRYVPTFEEALARLDKVSRDGVVKFYEEQIAASAGEISLVGDFDVDKTVKELEAIFAGFNKKAPKYQRIGQKAFTSVKGGRDSIDTPDKEGAVFVAAHVFAMQDDDPQYAPLELGNYILGGNFNSRLVDRLRQKEGLCYGAGSQVSVDSQDKYGMFMVFGICNPENIDKVDKGALEEVTKLAKKGVEPAEIETARKGYLEEQRVARSKDATLAAWLRQLSHLDRTFIWVADLEKKIGGLSVDDVNRAVAATVHPDRLVIVRAGDFSKKAPEKKDK
jgi:zinc protease